LQRHARVSSRRETALEWGAMYVELRDADIALHIADGDGEAEAELCRRMGPRIRLYGLRHLRSPSAADDLVQQVLLRVFEALRARFGSDLVPEPPSLPRLDEQRLARCVQMLKERERSVVVMTFYDEQTAAETAGLLWPSPDKRL